MWETKGGTCKLSSHEEQEKKNLHFLCLLSPARSRQWMVSINQFLLFFLSNHATYDFLKESMINLNVCQYNRSKFSPVPAIDPYIHFKVDILSCLGFVLCTTRNIFFTEVAILILVHKVCTANPRWPPFEILHIRTFLDKINFSYFQCQQNYILMA